MSTPNWFLALPLPIEARWQEAAVSAPPQLRRFVAADLHCTVAFLGPCGEQRAVAAWEVLADLRASAIAVTAGHWRAFGPARRPSAYGLTLSQGDQALGALLRRWAPLAREAAGLPSSPSPLPHVTLLRPRWREAAAAIEPMRQWMAQAPLPAAGAVLQELALYTWDPERRERLFRITARRSLG